MIATSQINTGADLKTLRQSLGLSQQACADMVHVTLNAWQKIGEGTWYECDENGNVYG
jgi:DNA-binding transcriptional regulator YiaG